jgi:hypothetical protein
VPDQVYFLPGTLPEFPEPLARYLPPLPQSIAPIWLRENILAGGLVLDPFGFSPGLVSEAARSGHKMLSVTYNPVIRFLLELAADPLSRSDLQSTLAELSISMRGDQRLEPYILSLYQTECASCGSLIPAEAFVWERNGNYPVQRIYRCPDCGDRGEYPTTQADNERAAQFTSSGLHRARALERVASTDDPDRIHVEEAISTYLPRALYVLLTLINKLDNLPAHHQRALRGLLLIAFDRSNTLWHYPAIRHRPRQLSTPLHFLEKNIWFSLETAAEELALYGEALGQPVPLTMWPELPPEGGGICIFDGRLKELLDSQPDLRVEGMLAALPRPNQAFWTYSALWSGWLWGSAIAAPFKVGLRRRRYDWGWHTSALHAAFTNSKPLIKDGAPVLGLAAEIEPGFLTAIVLSGSLASLQLMGISMRPERSQAQISWRNSSESEKSNGRNLNELLRQAAIEHIQQRGEPAEFLQLQAAGLQTLSTSAQINQLSEQSPAQAFGLVQAALTVVLSDDNDFIRPSPIEHAIEVGQWWLPPAANPPTGEQKKLPLADRVEMECVRYMLAHPSCTKIELDRAICRLFPGLLTPDEDLVLACLTSYGVKISPEGDEWQLQSQDAPQIRRKELVEMSGLLFRLGQKLGYSVETPAVHQVAWLEPGLIFYILASAIIGRVIENNPAPADACIIVLPGSRAPIILQKKRSNPILKQQIDEGWRFLKYRHLRRLYESQSLTQENLNVQLALDPVDNSDPQLKML